MSFHEKFVTARKMCNMTQVELREKLRQMDCEVTIGTLSRWETGKTHPSLQCFFAICKIFNIANPLEMFSDFYTPELNEEGLRKVKEYREDLILTGKYKPRTSYGKVPLYLLPASAGTGQLLDGEEFEWMEVDQPIPIGTDFAIRIAGDSMEPKYHDGEVVFIRKQNTLEDGEVGIFFWDGDAYIKQLRKTARGILLISLNADYAPIVIDESAEFRVFGKVL